MVIGLPESLLKQKQSSLRLEMGERLRLWRMMAGKSKGEVAADLGILWQCWHYYEIGARRMDCFWAAELVRIYPRFPLEWVVTGNQSKLASDEIKILRELKRRSNKARAGTTPEPKKPVGYE